MNANDNLYIMSAVKKAFLRPGIPSDADLSDFDKYYIHFEDINETTIRFHDMIEMHPVLKVTDDGVVLTCPLAYYETGEQRTDLLDFFEHSRQIWYNEVGLGPYYGECNEPNARINSLPDDLFFEDNPKQGLISAHLPFETDFILTSPEEFLSAIETVIWYPVAIRNPLSEVVYKNMPKTITDSASPKSYFFCTMLLVYRFHSNIAPFIWLQVDWFDVVKIIERSNGLIFYPSIASNTFDGLVMEIERTIKTDAADGGRFGVLVTLTVPNDCPDKYYNSQFNLNELHNRVGTDLLKTHVYLAEDNHPYTAEMVLLKMKA